MSDDTPNLEALTADLETWKGHSRNWETKAKDNLAALTTAQSELTTLKAELADTATKLADLDSTKDALSVAQADLARLSLAVEFGLSADDAKLLQGDEETQRAIAERLKPGFSKPLPNAHQGKDKDTPKDARSAFNALFEG